MTALLSLVVVVPAGLPELSDNRRVLSLPSSLDVPRPARRLQREIRRENAVWRKLASAYLCFGRNHLTQQHSHAESRLRSRFQTPHVDQC